MGRVLYEDRARAESFGAVARLYDRARPSYPPELVDALLVDGPRRVLDVGCGTGIASALFAEGGCTVLGVEVDARMADLARAKGLDVEVAGFERWDPGDRRFDLVISAQAWHWIDPEAGAVAAATVLSHGGRLGLFWNFGAPPADIRRRLAPIYARLAPDLENYSVVLGNPHTRLETTLAGIARSGCFAPAETATFPWRKRYSTGDWLEHLSTHSDHRALTEPDRRGLLGAVGDAVDAAGGSFEMPYETVLITARRA
jgi:SAM-dependent methyltransferase